MDSSDWVPGEPWKSHMIRRYGREMVTEALGITRYRIGLGGYTNEDAGKYMWGVLRNLSRQAAWAREEIPAAGGGRVTVLTEWPR